MTTTRRIAAHPWVTNATSGLFTKPSEMFAHGLNERLPVTAFYQGLDHIYRLAADLGGARPGR
jgi:carboxypeptidase PM20D1